MPKVSDGFKTEKIELPSYPGSEVSIKTNISVEEVQELQEGTGEMDQMLGLVSRLIKTWNFETEEGNPLEINKDILKKFPSIDLKFVIDKLTDIVKKKGSEKTK